MAKIISLKLTNFQGISSQNIDFGGLNTSIYGRNGTGKSTIANAIAWLLYDKPANGAANYSPKTYGDNGHIHNLDHTAEMVIELDGGTVLTLKRVYHEVYHKKRGTNNEEFDGHTTDHFVDGVPITEKEYKNRVVEICPPDMAKVLTQPWYFAEALSKDARRSTLLEVCGNITDKDVIDATPQIADLSEILRKPGTSGDLYTVDDYRKIAAARKAEINRELQAIPARIDEATLAIPQVVLPAADIDRQITEKAAEIAEANKKLAEIKTPASNDEADAAIRTEIANIEAQMAEGRAKHAEKENATQTAYNAQINDVHTRVGALKLDGLEKKHEADDKRRVLAGMRGDLEATKTHRAQLLKKHNEVSAQVWDSANETCPTCNRKLPEKDIEKMREEFNTKRSGRLEELTAEGRKVGKDAIAAKEAAIAEIQKNIAELDVAAAELEAKAAATRSELDRIKTPRKTDYSETDEYKALLAKLGKARLDRNTLTAKVNVEASAAIDAQEAVIKKLTDELEAIQQVKANTEQSAKLQDRINELSKQEKRLSEDYERTERGLYLCEVFVRAKVSMLTDSINKKFTRVRFRLFKEQNNGGLTDDCEVLVPGQGGAFVPWGEGANTGAKINAGLEIIKVLSQHYRTSLPIVCDNAEAVSDWTDVDAQLIRLVVTTTDDKLRVEYNEE